MSWSDNRRVSTDIGWYMPYFTTAEYGWQVREPIHDMLIRIIDNTYDPEYMPDYREEIHFIADQMIAPDRKIDGKDCRYVSTMKKLLIQSFHMLDISRAQWEYVAPGGEPYPFDQPCDDEIISIWYATDPTIVREQSYKAFMKLAYGDWINYDKKCTLVESPKTVVCTVFTRVTVHGTTNGLGTMILGKNYLKQKTTPIPNGCIGTLAGGVAAFTDVLTGYTFNTGNFTKIYGVFSYPDGGDGNVISSANMGNLMMVEGTTIPSAYDADTNLCKEPIYQGTTCYQDYTNGEVVGTSQMFFAGQDQYGRTNTFINRYWTDRKTHIGPITVKPNTDYSVRLFGCSYPTMLLGINAVTEAGTITPTFTRLWNQKTIPTNEAFGDAETATEQWINLAYQYYDYLRARVRMPIDLRPIRYEFCESFAELKAGTYKLMIDEWGNYDLDNDWVGFSPCSGCYEDNWDGQQTDVYEWFALVKEDNTPVISKTSLFDASMQSYENRRSKTSPFPNYFHKEFTFTLTEDAKVGVIHKAYYNSRTYTYPPYFRFYIVDADEEAEEFTTTGCSPTNMTGYSAWEKYQSVVSISVKFTNVVDNTSTTLTKTVPSLLYSGDFVDFTEDLPTYSADDYGIVIVEVLDKDQEDPTIMPTIDINYH